MELLIDFNRVEKDGRIPVRLPDPASFMIPHEGSKVTVYDGEGTRCTAEVDELAPDVTYVMVRLVPGTVEDYGVPSVRSSTA